MRFGIFKIMVFSYICIVEDKVVLHNIKMYGKTMILKIPYLMICLCSSFEILKGYCRPPYPMML